MKKEYEAPKAEKLEFAYSEVVTASGQGSGLPCILGSAVSWQDAAGNQYRQEYPGDE